MSYPMFETLYHDTSSSLDMEGSEDEIAVAELTALSARPFSDFSQEPNEEEEDEDSNYDESLTTEKPKRKKGRPPLVLSPEDLAERERRRKELKRLSNARYYRSRKQRKIAAELGHPVDDDNGSSDEALTPPRNTKQDEEYARIAEELRSIPPDLLNTEQKKELRRIAKHNYYMSHKDNWKKYRMNQLVKKHTDNSVLLRTA